MELTNILDMKLDYWSIQERLGEIDSYHWDYSQSEYYGDYADLFIEMAIIAADLYNDLEALIRELDCAGDHLLPQNRKMADVEGYRGGDWFDKAVSVLTETNMSVLLENHGVFDPDDIEAEKGRRSRAIMALTKSGMYFLFTEVFNFTMRYIQLDLAFQAVCGSIDELERLNSFREHNGVPQLPSAAYV